MDSTRIVSIVLFVFIRLQHSFGTAAVSSNVSFDLLYVVNIMACLFKEVHVQ